ncbi:hypothetical protein [Arthrobacter sp. Bz4]|uniref:hypothetical protein n=1 Tax=Arthrobacter sp. Bz4 TaxID=2171979 RepID=UPI0014040F5B|nr:hypothetical protein [Arthrobacter sp. Bz4]
MTAQHSLRRTTFITEGVRSSVAAVRRQPPAAVIIALLITATYSVYSVAQWNRLATPSWDLGIFTQLAKAYAASTRRLCRSRVTASTSWVTTSIRCW